MKKRERASAVVVRDGKLLTVILEDPHTRVRQHFPPGGAVEKGETPAQAAVRETLEETGVAITLTAHPPHTAVYPFVWNNVTYECTTHFYAAVCADDATGTVDDADYNKGSAWILVSKLEDYLGFDREILHATRAVIRSAFTHPEIVTGKTSSAE